MLTGVVLLIAVVGGVGAMAYQAGLETNAVTQVVQAAPAGAEGGTVIVRGMYPGYGYYGHGYGHPFGFLHFIFFFLFVGFIFKLFAFGFRGGHRGEHRGGWGGPGGWEDRARQRHDEWHAGNSSAGESGAGGPPASTAV